MKHQAMLKKEQFSGSIFKFMNEFPENLILTTEQLKLSIFQAFKTLKEPCKRFLMKNLSENLLQVTECGTNIASS